MAEPKLTPAMRQYDRFKKQHPDCVLFFRMGDFYEMFNEDALTAHKALGITLTQRTEGVPMAGVPHHAVDGYLRRMIEAGYRVAVCDQVQDPKEAKGVVDRAVTRVVTPGTLVEDSLLADGRQNLVAAVAFTESGDDSPGVLAVVEASTGTFELSDTHANRLADDLARLSPSELLYADTANGQIPPRLARALAEGSLPTTPRPAWHFRHSDAREALLKHFGVNTLDGFGLSADDPALSPAGAVLLYLQETQTPHEADTRLHHLQPPRRRRADSHVVLDAAVLRSLELERTMRAGEVEGSLLGTLNKCRTPRGGGLMRGWLCYPLRDRTQIEARLGVVSTFVESAPLADRVRQEIEGIQDVARIAGRLGIGRATPRDLVALGRSAARARTLEASLEGATALAPQSARLAVIATTLEDLAERIGAACIDSPPTHAREGGIIRDGYDAELDELRTLQSDANSWLATYQKRLIDETNLSKLKVGYNRVFGYYIELSRTAAADAPDSFTRKQTLKNAERYITPELKEFENKITSAEAKAIERERHLFAALCAAAGQHVRELGAFAELVAELDILLCFADRARRLGYVRPMIVEEPVLDIRQGRHPVLDERLGENFVPNDCELGNVEGAEEPYSLALITGPNMAGKSTYIRQNALIVLLAHVGCFVPAESATIGLVDRIFTRVGASDELHLGQSTFMVEMTETANILHHASERSLVILDEIGRGTSTLDGLSLAWAIAERLAGCGSRTLFATHYHELTDLAESLPAGQVGNLHVAVREWEGEVIFLHRILPGRTNQSYGIHVAKIAGVPPETIARADAILQNLERSHHHGRDLTQAADDANDEQGHSGTSGGRRVVREMEQLPLFTEYLPHPAVELLRSVDLHALTPLAAFDLLRKLKQELDSPGETTDAEA